MTGERTANSKRNIIFGVLQVMFNQILPFITRTIFIYRLGVEYLGLNSLFTSILGILSLMELGFGSAIVFSMYKPVADGDTDLICAYLEYYKKIYRWIGLTILGIGLLLMPFLKLLIRDPTIPGDLNLHVCYLLYLGNSVISYLLFGYMTAIPTAYQRQDLLSKIGIGTSVLKCVVQSVILLLSINYYIYLIVMPVMTVVQNLATAYVVKKRYPIIECRGTLSQEQRAELNKQVRGLIVNNLTNVSRNSIDSLCISMFIGLTVTGMYSNYLFIMSAVLSCTVVLGHSMTPSVGNSLATESKEKNYADLRIFDFLYMAIVGWATVSMLCLYQPFIGFWAGEGMQLEVPVAVGMSLYFYVLDSGAINWAYVMGAGLWYECRFIMIGESIANIVLNIVLCKYMGVTGIVLATIISVFATNCVFVPKMLFNGFFKNGKLKEYWIDHLLYTTTMLLTAAISWLACENLLPGTGIGVLIRRGLICTFISLAVFWLLWHKSERYGKAVSWIKKMIRA